MQQRKQAAARSSDTSRFTNCDLSRGWTIPLADDAAGSEPGAGCTERADKLDRVIADSTDAAPGAIWSPADHRAATRRAVPRVGESVPRRADDSAEW